MTRVLTSNPLPRAVKQVLWQKPPSEENELAVGAVLFDFCAPGVATQSQKPVGWFTRYACSSNTRELLAEHGGYLYDSLAMKDDLPYYVHVLGTTSVTSNT